MFLENFPENNGKQYKMVNRKLWKTTEQDKHDKLPSDDAVKESPMSKLGRLEAIKPIYNQLEQESHFSDFERLDMKSKMFTEFGKNVRVEEHPSYRYMILFVLGNNKTCLSRRVLEEKIMIHFDIEYSISFKTLLTHYLNNMVEESLLWTSSILTWNNSLQQYRLNCF